MRIGIDFDNTIVCCDPLFHRAALDKKLIPPEVGVAKNDVRDHLRRVGQEPAWTELQGYVYGDLLKEARPFPGVVDFFCACAKRNIPVFVVSHKTKKPFLGPPYDLHKAALDWLAAHGFFEEAGLRRDVVFLEPTKQAKLQRIASLACTHFIDDLPEFLTDPAFPKGISRIHFNPNNVASETGVIGLSSWPQITAHILKN
jgi:hypothetical protein